MLLRQSGALLVAATAANALRNASPFFLLSTEAIKSDSPLQTSQLSTAAHVEESLLSALDDCAASLYILVEQAGAHASDLRDGSVMPAMQRRMASGDYRSVVQVPEVMGEMDTIRIADSISRKCNLERTNVQEYHSAGRKGHSAVLGPLQLPVLKSDVVLDVRREILSQADLKLDGQLDSVLANHTSHVIIYVSRSAAEGERAHYEMDEPPYHAIMHTDLKRDVGEEGVEAAKETKEANPQDGLPLFEKYQFLSPGIFMGLTISLLLGSILYVGVSAIAGLEVSYMAFSKENGPSAQKKQ
ncbi:uncharacterized protein RCC_04100 [Ramularia collo-cygni]|uniref:Protein BIG1 n=1 Tax=Ramularia collo-cygni TaxID=112498 RepID=A0A2D3UVN2_9PEZI|nr:uncharacterized protein RCC_04100 [Ramularia collo-cygni]CZT18255.1 uncharacterized protein RCC_04100 [Ramularia collo-cygni]